MLAMGSNTNEHSVQACNPVIAVVVQNYQGVTILFLWPSGHSVQACNLVIAIVVQDCQDVTILF